MNENEAKTICLRYWNYRGIKPLTYKKISNSEYRPVLIMGGDNIISVYDSYKNVVDNILFNIIHDLEENGGWTDSFYLSREDLNNLDLNRFIEIDGSAVAAVENALRLRNRNR